MDKHTYAAIIGYWRQGATVSEISAVTGVKKETIIAIIELYARQN